MKLQPKLELNKVRQVSDVIDDTFQFFRQNWKPLLKAYFTICGFFLAASLLVFVFNQLRPAADGNGTVFGINFLLGVVFNFFSITVTTLTVLSYISVYKEKGNIAPTVDEVWGYVKFYAFRAFVASFLLQAALTIGFVFCFFPGVYLFPVFSLVLPVMIIENTTLGYAFNRAFQLANNNWGPVFGALILIVFIIGAALLTFALPAALIAQISTMVSGKSPGSILGLLFGIAAHVFQFLYILPVISSALLYFSLSEQRDGLSLLQRIDMLGRNETGPDEQPAEEY